MLNPGDPTAVEQGCQCPSEQNQDGQGTYLGVQGGQVHFLIREDCPMHGKETWRDSAPTPEGAAA